MVIAKPDMDHLRMHGHHAPEKVRHLPVLDHNEISGIITIRDVVKAVVHEQNVVIKDLENYIMGGGYGANP
jgi:CBS domain-containing protein